MTSPHIVKLVERNRSQHKGPRLYEDPDWMRDAYVGRGMTLRQMAAESDCGLRTIARWMQVHGIPTDRGRIAEGARLRSGENHPRYRAATICPACGGPRSKAAGVCRGCSDTTGAKNPKWRGDDASYETLHFRIAAVRGRASDYRCAHCEGAAEQWAYDNADSDERPRGKGHGPYSLNPEHYMPMCNSCHKRQDYARARQERTGRWAISSPAS